MHGPYASIAAAVDGKPLPARDVLIVGCDGAVSPEAVSGPLGLGRVKVVIPETTEEKELLHI